MPDRKVFIPEVVEPDETLPRDLVALRKFAYLMDEALPVPGTRRRVGLDAGLSLIPGVGEVIGGVLSAWIIIGALRHRVPIRRVAKMVFYVLIDMLAGSVPVIGTIFDWLFEENVINIRSLLEHRDRARPPRSILSILGAAAVVIVLIYGVAMLILAATVAAILWIAGKR